MVLKISVAGLEKSQISVVTRRKAYHKRGNKQAERLAEEKLKLIKKLILTQSPPPKNSRKILASSLRKLLEIQKFQVKQETYNIMFKYLLVWEESTTGNTLESSTNQICIKKTSSKYITCNQSNDEVPTHLPPISTFQQQQKQLGIVSPPPTPNEAFESPLINGNS